MSRRRIRATSVAFPLCLSVQIVRSKRADSSVRNRLKITNAEKKPYYQSSTLRGWASAGIANDVTLRCTRRGPQVAATHTPQTQECFGRYNRPRVITNY